MKPVENIGPAPNQDIIEMLETLLFAAYAGDIQDIGIVYSDIRGEVDDCFAVRHNVMPLLGRLSMLERRLIDYGTDILDEHWEYDD